MTEADDKPTAQLPPKSPEWMRAAVGKPFEELPEGLQHWIGNNELDVHIRFAQDVKHCEADLVQLNGQRGRFSFKEFDAARSLLEKQIDAAKSQQKRLADAEPADRLLVLAWIIEGLKSTGDRAQTAGEDARPAPPPAEAPKAPASNSDDAEVGIISGSAKPRPKPRVHYKKQLLPWWTEVYLPLHRGSDKRPTAAEQHAAAAAEFRDYAPPSKSTMRNLRLDKATPAKWREAGRLSDSDE